MIFKRSGRVLLIRSTLEIQGEDVETSGGYIVFVSGIMPCKSAVE